MIRPVITLRRKRVIVDVDTQKDLFLAEGSACIRNHRRVLANIRRVVAWARRRNIRMISTVRVRSGDDSKCDYCTEGANGQKKISYTVRSNHVCFAADGCTDLDRNILAEYDQVIVCKRCHDPFSEPRADRILSELRANEFILFGATAEDAVKTTALGLLARGKAVTILTDAVGTHNRGAAEIALRQAEAKGAKLTDTKTLLGHSSLRFVGVCKCDRCRGRATKPSISAIG